jgi:hypothetical protein
MEKFLQKIRSFLLHLATATFVVGMAIFSVSANPVPPNVDTATMDTLVEIVFWAVRIMILGVGGVPAAIKIVQGQTNEDVRERNGGITAAIVTGVMFAATFGIEALF